MAVTSAMNVRWILSADGHQRWRGLITSVGNKWCFDISNINSIVGLKSVFPVLWGKKLVGANDCVDELSF